MVIIVAECDLFGLFRRNATGADEFDFVFQTDLVTCRHPIRPSFSQQHPIVADLWPLRLQAPRVRLPLRSRCCRRAAGKSDATRKIRSVQVDRYYSTSLGTERECRNGGTLASVLTSPGLFPRSLNQLTRCVALWWSDPASCILWTAGRCSSPSE